MVAQVVLQHLSQDWERDSQLTEVDHAYSLLYKSRYVYNTSVVTLPLNVSLDVGSDVHDTLCQ